MKDKKQKKTSEDLPENPEAYLDLSSDHSSKEESPLALSKALTPSKDLMPSENLFGGF